MIDRKKLPKPRFNVGDVVTISRPPYRPLAVVIEYRGPLGGGGEHVYRIRRLDADSDYRETEQSESGMTPADAPAAAT